VALVQTNWPAAKDSEPEASAPEVDFWIVLVSVWPLMEQVLVPSTEAVFEGGAGSL